MVMSCIAAAAATITVVAAAAAAAADSSTRCRQSSGPLHGAARLRKRQGAGRLWCWVVNVVDEVVSVAVAVDMTVAVLGAGGLLRGRGLHAARMGVAQGQVTWGRPPARGVLLTAGWESGHGCARVLRSCA